MESQSKPEWANLGLSDQVLKLVEEAGYKTPTAVQAQTIPIVLEGHDLVVSSQTGSGKTATFVLPMVEKLKGKEGTFGLILSPTREIAQQTHAVLEKFGKPLGIRSAVLIGGVPLRTDGEVLATYPQIIVATPGRLCDHIEQGNIWLDFIKMFVIDEADVMLDMGFSAQLNRIMEELPMERQAMVFSATFPRSVDALVSKVVKDPKKITIGVADTKPPNIEQGLLKVRDDEKTHVLADLLDQEPGTVMVFARSKDRVSKLWNSLFKMRVDDSTFLHSDCTQKQREQAIIDFKSGKYRVLIATDVAGRGIDVENVAHVINYDLPLDAMDYVHRIGRTGRKGKSGRATSLVTLRDRQSIQEIETLIKKKIPVLTSIRSIFGKTESNQVPNDRSHASTKHSKSSHSDHSKQMDRPIRTGKDSGHRGERGERGERSERPMRSEKADHAVDRPQSKNSEMRNHNPQHRSDPGSNSSVPQVSRQKKHPRSLSHSATSKHLDEKVNSKGTGEIRAGRPHYDHTKPVVVKKVESSSKSRHPQSAGTGTGATKKGPPKALPPLNMYSVFLGKKK